MILKSGYRFCSIPEVRDISLQRQQEKEQRQ